MDAPESLNQLRPIALCTVVVKVITKVLANIIKPLMDKLISPQQCSFILGRQASDNVILAQEALHSMRRKKGKMGYFAGKLDLEKAYDCISWGFLEQVLVYVGID